MRHYKVEEIIADATAMAQASEGRPIEGYVILAVVNDPEGREILGRTGGDNVLLRGLISIASERIAKEDYQDQDGELH